MDHNPYATPEAAVASPENEVLDSAPFYIISTRKVAILTVATFNFYFVYWFYRNWRQYRAATGEKVMPVARAIFNIFFVHALLRDVDTVIREKGLVYSWNHANLAGVYVILAVGGNLASRYEPSGTAGMVIHLLILLTVPLLAWVGVAMQRPINLACGDVDGSSNASLTAANWIWIILGGLFWFLSLAGYYTIWAGHY